MVEASDQQACPTSLLSLLEVIDNYFVSFFQDRVLVLVQAGLKLMILLSQPPECWNYKHVPLCLV
jgi:hypothetical protein